MDEACVTALDAIIVSFSVSLATSMLAAWLFFRWLKKRSRV